MTAAATAASLLVASAAVWTVVLAMETGRPAVATVSLAVGLWTAGVAAVAGLLIARGRWARRLGVIVAAAEGAVALVTPVNVLWWVGLGIAAATAIALAGPWLNGWVRLLPAAAGPPSRAVMVPLLLIGVPFVVGWGGAEDLAAAAVGAVAVAVAFWFIRTLPFALVAVRVVWPITALVCAWFLGWPLGVVVAAMAAVVTVLAWHPSVTRAVVPLVEQGSIVPIPPELAPQDVLDAAQVDERGRRL